MTISTRERPAGAWRRAPHARGGGHDHPAGHASHGDHAAMLRDRFWLTLSLAVPAVIFSGMFQDLLGYTAAFPWSWLISPALGTVIFFYGGWPFLAGAVAELRGRRPGMMLQIGIPKQVREIFGLRPGDSLLLLADREKGIALVDPAEYTELTDKIIGPGPDASGAAGEGS